MKKIEEIEKYVQKNKESFDTDKFIEWLKNDEVLVPECIKIGIWSDCEGIENLSIIFNDNKQELFLGRESKCYLVGPSMQPQLVQCSLKERHWKDLKIGDIAFAGRIDKDIEDIEFYYIKISKSGFVCVRVGGDSIPNGVECYSGCEDDDLVYKLIPTYKLTQEKE
jgi:hypothetical protein